MEIKDIYDKYRRKIGIVPERGSNMEKGEHHISVHVWIINSKGEFLVQKRQLNKKGVDKNDWGGMWDCAAGGCAISGDDSIDTVIIETKEEIGLNVKDYELEPLFTVKFPRGFDDNWLLEKDIDLKDLVLQKEEVTDIKWIRLEEIYQMIDKGNFIPFQFLDRLCEIYKSNIIIKKSNIEKYKFSPGVQYVENITKKSNKKDYYAICFKTY